MPIWLVAHLIEIWARMQSPRSVWLVVRMPFSTSFAVLYGSVAAIRTDNAHCLRKLTSLLLDRTLAMSLVRRSSRSQTRNMSGLPFADLRARKIVNSSSRVVVVISWFSRTASPVPVRVGIALGLSSTNEGFRRLNLAISVATSLRRRGAVLGVIIVPIGYSPHGGISEMHRTLIPIRWY
jgi:hypothetical protein